MEKIAILYPGDMGGHVAKVLTEKGYGIISYLQERNTETKKQAKLSGIISLASLSAVAKEADFVISLVPPNAVLEVAKKYIAATDSESKARFIDMNAKSVKVAEKLSEMFKSAVIPFCNACIIGRAAFVAEEGIIYYSGEVSKSFESIFGSCFRVVYLGDNVASATAFKMCFAGFNKTITAAFFETARAANHYKILHSLFEEIENKMPGIIKDISKIIGTYPKHIVRRKTEMESLAEMLKDEGLPNYIAKASAQVFNNIDQQQNFASINEQKTEMIDLLKLIK